MFWLLLLSHILADYPLQTDGMVRAKKQLSGLLMHVFIHFVTMLAILTYMTELEVDSCFMLALSISCLHLAIDHWKNVLSRLQSTWGIFTYLQDQSLHLISLVVVCFIYQQVDLIELFSVENQLVFDVIGFVLITHIWFVTERVFAKNNTIKLQWLNRMMWPRMMSRGLIYSLFYSTEIYTALLICIAAVIVVWNDLETEKRLKTIAMDFAVSLLLMAVICLMGENFFN